MGFGHLSSPAFFNGVIGPLLVGINHGQQRCRSNLDDISGQCGSPVTIAARRCPPRLPHPCCITS
jgi:hypothetical protein